MYLTLAALSSKLPHRFHQQKAPVHPGMGVGKSPAVGVEREVPSRRGPLVGHEVGGLSGPAKAQPFQSQHHGVGERVVDHGQVDVVVGDSGPGQGLGTRIPGNQ